LEVFDFRQIELYSYRKGFWNDKEIIELARETEGDRQPRFSSLTIFTPLMKIKWKTWLFELHDLAFSSFITDFEGLTFSLLVSPYNDDKKIYENYKITFTKTVKIKFDDFDMTDTTNAYGPEVTSLDIKEIKDGLYEAKIILLYGEHCNSYIMNLWFEDINIDKLSESENIKFRFGSWQTRVDIKN
ncbi:MAG TPA: hypothetical protein VHO28_04810, partial [Ignavibacteriales bacterium]|nr:hypothetical protein [Ignavibacteriales bacterium]